MLEGARDRHNRGRVLDTHAISTIQDIVPQLDVVSNMYAVSATAAILPRTVQDNNVQGENDHIHSRALDNYFVPLPNGVHSPVRVDRLSFFLAAHPDQGLVAYVIDGFRFGFDIGYEGPVLETRPRNLLSARSNAGPVTTAIRKELSLVIPQDLLCLLL